MPRHHGWTWTRKQPQVTTRTSRRNRIPAAADAAILILMTLPLIIPIRQTMPQPVIADVPGETKQSWRESGVLKRLKPGDRVAVGVGSRGIANLAVIVRATLDVLREAGTKPFVVAAMGSHGGATAEGQRELLAEYGVSE